MPVAGAGRAAARRRQLVRHGRHQLPPRCSAPTGRHRPRPGPVPPATRGLPHRRTPRRTGRPTRRRARTTGGGWPGGGRLAAVGRLARSPGGPGPAARGARPGPTGPAAGRTSRTRWPPREPRCRTAPWPSCRTGPSWRPGWTQLAAGIPGPAAVGTAAADPGRTVLVFPGQGAQWPAMGTRLMEQSPVFRDRVLACAEAFAPHLGWSVADVLRGRRARPRRTVRGGAAGAVHDDGRLAAVWRSLGIRPAAVVGHSQGEIAAAHVAGLLSLPDAAAVVALRVRALETLAGTGGMVSTALPLADARHARSPPTGGWRSPRSTAQPRRCSPGPCRRCRRSRRPWKRRGYGTAGCRWTTRRTPPAWTGSGTGCSSCWTGSGRGTAGSRSTRRSPGVRCPARRSRRRTGSTTSAGRCGSTGRSPPSPRPGTGCSSRPARTRSLTASIAGHRGRRPGRARPRRGGQPAPGRRRLGPRPALGRRAARAGSGGGPGRCRTRPAGSRCRRTRSTGSATGSPAAGAGDRDRRGRPSGRRQFPHGRRRSPHGRPVAAARLAGLRASGQQDLLLSLVRATAATVLGHRRRGRGRAGRGVQRPGFDSTAGSSCGTGSRPRPASGCPPRSSTTSRPRPRSPSELRRRLRDLPAADGAAAPARADRRAGRHRRHGLPPSPAAWRSPEDLWQRARDRDRRDRRDSRPGRGWDGRAGGRRRVPRRRGRLRRRASSASRRGRPWRWTPSSGCCSRSPGRRSSGPGSTRRPCGDRRQVCSSASWRRTTGRAGSRRPRRSAGTC